MAGCVRYQEAAETASSCRLRGHMKPGYETSHFNVAPMRSGHVKTGAYRMG
jgi:hypothetical protein